VLETLAGSRVAAHRVVQRAQVLLLAADGVSNSEIGEVVGVSCPTVLAWRGQFEKEGLAGFGEVGKDEAANRRSVMRRWPRSWT
jgi:transposase